jgi:hypothetical protein
MTEVLTKKLKMEIKMSFNDNMSDVQKDSQDVSTGIGQFLKIQYIRIFFQNFMSKLARSTLTSLDRIKVKAGSHY